MTVYIVIGTDKDQNFILAVCDSEDLALSRKRHFDISHSDLIISIEEHAVECLDSE